MAYRSSYELDLDVGFALLEQMEDATGPRRYESDPDAQDWMERAIVSGVHGGHVDFDEPQEFFVYTIDWPAELHDRYDDEVLESLSSELDGLFPGWVFDREQDKVFILSDTELPESMQE